MSPEHWPGDSGDVVAALWPTIVDRVIKDATETALNLVGLVIGQGDLGTQQYTALAGPA